MIEKRIVFLIYNGFELMDVSGPSGVFNNSNLASGNVSYKILLVSELGGDIVSSEGFHIGSQSINDITIGKSDTVLVAGGRLESLSLLRKSSTIHEWLVTSERACERLGSVCTGAFVLAEAGLLDDKPAATHWMSVGTLQQEFPTIRVKEEALYVNDGKIWTSAGVTTGIDMALEIVKRDLGSDTMAMVAKGMVVYAHRPGNQSQFSQLLSSQMHAGQGFSELLLWIETNLHKTLRVHDLSEFVHMSERTFYRRFTKAIGLTPSKYIEKTRLLRAKDLLEDNISVKQVMQIVGFHSDASFRQAFVAFFGVTPSVYKKIHKKPHH